MKSNGFVLREYQEILYYSCLAFESLPWLRHGFSTRHGGKSDSGYKNLNLGNSLHDSPECIHENQKRFLSALNLKESNLATLHQIHSDRICLMDDKTPAQIPLEGDALISRLNGAAVGVKIADCIPILIADPEQHAVAAVHSGWRGTQSRILSKTINEMRRFFGSNPSQLFIAVGPGIRSCCYEVGSEVAELFEQDYPNCRLVQHLRDRSGKYHLDLIRALEIQLDLVGVRSENCFDLNMCTCCNTQDFFSYRAEGAASGRMMAVIGLKGE